MTILRHHAARHDDRRTAAAARSILSCPSTAELVVDGVADVLGDADGGDPAGRATGVRERAGEPVFSCAPGSRLAGAAAAGRRALLTLTSGLGRPGSTERRATLTLGGSLAVRDREDCSCCGEPRDVVALVVDLVSLDQGAGRPPVRVPVDQFRAREHQLNRGYLQRSVEHANDHHQDELRRGVSTMTATPFAEVLGAGLSDLRPGGVEVRWVTPEGAHRAALAFPRAARSSTELGDLLRRVLHA